MGSDARTSRSGRDVPRVVEIEATLPDLRVRRCRSAEFQRVERGQAPFFEGPRRRRLTPVIADLIQATQRLGPDLPRGGRK